MPLCSVCRRGDIDEIDEQIRRGTPISQLVRAFEVNRNAMSRHRQHAMSAAGRLVAGFDHKTLTEAWLEEQDRDIREGIRLTRRHKQWRVMREFVTERGDLLRALAARSGKARSEPEQMERDVTPIDDASQERAARLLLESRGYVVTRQDEPCRVREDAGLP